MERHLLSNSSSSTAVTMDEEESENMWETIKHFVYKHWIFFVSGAGACIVLCIALVAIHKCMKRRRRTKMTFKHNQEVMRPWNAPLTPWNPEELNGTNSESVVYEDNRTNDSLEPRRLVQPVQSGAYLKARAQSMQHIAEEYRNRSRTLQLNRSRSLQLQPIQPIAVYKRKTEGNVAYPAILNPFDDQFDPQMEVIEAIRRRSDSLPTKPSEWTTFEEVKLDAEPLEEETEVPTPFGTEQGTEIPTPSSEPVTDDADQDEADLRALDALSVKDIQGEHMVTSATGN